jgi:hypothetical protein
LSLYILNFSCMRILITVVCLIGSIQWLSAQFGAGASYLNGRLQSQPETGSTSLNASGYLFGVHYWFRLKNVRVEFLPELNYSQLQSSRMENLSRVQVDKWGLSLPVSFYLLEFKGDCHCPTFSRQKDLLKKGLFLQLIGTLQNEKSNQSPEWQLHPGIGLGAGMDLGLSDLVTMTPLLQYIHQPGSSPLTTGEFRAGLRILFRPDYR